MLFLILTADNIKGTHTQNVIIGGSSCGEDMFEGARRVESIIFVVLSRQFDGFTSGVGDFTTDIDKTLRDFNDRKEDDGHLGPVPAVHILLLLDYGGRLFGKGGGGGCCGPGRKAAKQSRAAINIVQLTGCGKG